MLEGQYRGHGIDGRSKENRRVVLTYYWFDTRFPLFVPLPSAKMNFTESRLGQR